MKAFPTTRSSGFSLVELMIGIGIVGILTMVAVPAFQTWFQNSQIRNAAESVANGLQRARAEAVARNTNVKFVLGAGSSWTVNSSDGTQVDKRDSGEGSKNVTLTVLPAGATTITFNSLGSVGASPPSPLNSDGTAPFTQVDLVAAGGNQNLQVRIGVGGNARMCDPNLPVTIPPNPRAC